MFHIHLIYEIPFSSEALHSPPIYTRAFNDVQISGNDTIWGINDASEYTFISRGFGRTWMRVFTLTDFVLWGARINGVTYGTLVGGIEYHMENRTIKNVSVNPNPFNSDSKLIYHLTESGNMMISIYNVLGQEIKKLQNGYLVAGWHNVDLSSNDFKTGVYVAILQHQRQTNAVKFIILK